MSVRLALWVTRAYAGHLDVAEAVEIAAADATILDSPSPPLQAWTDLGETALLVALPRPGDLTGLPRGGSDFVAAALAAGECVFVPALGAALVPQLASFGSTVEPGLSVSWETFDCEPTPRHRLEALSLRDIESQLRQQMTSAIGHLESIESTIWPQSDSVHDLLAEQVDRVRWGLPPGISPRAFQVLELAATLGSISELAATAGTSSSGTLRQTRREDVVRRLGAAADRALADATCVAALAMAGLRPGRED